MKSTKLLSSTCIAMVLMTLATTAIAQTQAIHTLKMTDGTENRAYNTDALIDMQSTSRGLLLPRVELTSTTATAPLAAHTAGMVVYNTVTVNDVTPGYYYDDGSKWVRLGASSGSGWALTGNTGITANNATYGNSLSAGTGNFLGSINSADLILAANNKEGIRINTSQQVLIGTTTVPTGGSLAKVIIDNGTVNGAIQIKDGSQADGYVLTSDANGVAKWKNVTQTVQNNISVSSTVDANILGYTPSTTATAASASATFSIGTTLVTKQGDCTYSVNGHSYAAYSSSTVITWLQAYNAAKSLGGYLATFVTDGEWQYAETNLLNPNTYFNTAGAWIGLCKFVWNAGSAATPASELKWITGEYPSSIYPSTDANPVQKCHWYGSSQPDGSGSGAVFIHTLRKDYATASFTRSGYTTYHAWNDASISEGTSVTGTTIGFIVEFNQ